MRVINNLEHTHKVWFQKQPESWF